MNWKMLSIFWKSNKSPSCDDISCNVVRKIFWQLVWTLKIFVSSLNGNRYFSRRLKISTGHSDHDARIYKGEDSSDVSNYRPISVLPCSSKILKRIMYNGLSNYLIENDILYSKQLGFQDVHSTDHAML